MLILIAPPTTTARAIRDRLAAWSRGALLEPFLWWDADEAGELTEVDVVSSKGVDREDLAVALRGEAEDVTLAVLIPVVSDDALPVGSLEAWERRSQLLGEILGFRDVPLVGLVVPERGDIALEASVAAHHWRSLVVIAPEDRRSPAPNDTDHLGTGATDFIAHAAAQVATLAALWAALPAHHDSPLSVAVGRTDHPDSTDAQVVRGFTRLADGGYLLDHVAARAMRPRDAWPVPNGPFYGTELDGQMQQYLVDAFYDEHRRAFGWVEPERPSPPPQRLTFAQALELILEMIKRYLFEIPWRILKRIVCGFVDLVANVLEWFLRRLGSDRKVWRCGATEPEEPPEEHTQPVPPAPRDRSPAAQVWNDLRALCIGLVDGSTLPEFVKAADLVDPLRRGVITAREQIVPDPAANLPESIAVILGVATPRPCDIWAIDRLESELTSLLGLLEARDKRNDPSATEELHELRQRIAGARLALKDLQEWRGHAGDSLVWAICRHLSIKLIEAHTAREAADEALRRLEAPEDQEAQAVREKKARGAKRFHRFLAALEGLVTLAAAGTFGYVWWSDDWAVVPTGLVVLAVWAALMLPLRWLRRGRHKVSEQGLDRDAALIEARRRVETAVKRFDLLDQRYDELLDWGEIIGWLVHHPWARRAATDLEPPDAIDHESLPVSCAYEVALIEEDDLATIVASTTAALFDEGWLNDVYFDTRDELGRRELRLRGVEDPSVTPDDPAEDKTARKALVAALRAHEHESVREQTMTNQVKDVLGHRRPEDTFAGLLPLSDDVQSPTSTSVSLPPISYWRDPPKQLDELARAVRPAIVKVLSGGGAAGGSGTIISEDGLIVTNRHVVKGASSVQVRLDDERVVEAIVRRVSDHTDLALVQMEEAPAKFIGIGPWPEVSQGERIFTLGFPLHLEGEPTLSWGIISALHRVETFEGDPQDIEVFQHDAPTTGGASGSGIFDTHLNLVGVHVGGHRGPIGSEYMKFGVPSWEVENLVAEVRARSEPSQRQAAEPSRIVAPIALVAASPSGESAQAIDAFFSELHRDGDAFDFRHWRSVAGVDQSSLPSVDRVEVVPVGAVTSPNLEFGRPWRVQALRVEFARLCAPGALTWFPELDEVPPSAPPAWSPPDDGSTSFV